jgi:nucleoside-diphosphate kinase
MKNPNEEKTVVLIKPDGVERGLIGEIIGRIEQRGLKIIALEMIWATREQMDNHYPKNKEWINRLGEKTKASYEKYGYDVKKETGTEDLMEIGKMVRGWILDFMTSGPLIKMIVQGVHAIDMMRKLAGHTIPAMAEMGTIRGDFSVDSPVLANKEKRGIKNIVHASENVEEAENEIKLWFSPEEIHNY